MSTKLRYEQADVLVVGAGLAGAEAALKAAEDGASVIVLEQANARRSGNAGSGVDHMHGYLPPVHGPKGYRPEDMKWDKAEQAFQNIGFGRVEFTDFFVDHSYDVLIGLEKYGVRVRGFEDSEFPEKHRVVPQFHSIPTSLHVEGRDVKVALTKGMIDAGVNVVNRAQAVELLKSGDAVTGAIAVSSREDEIVVVSAKATVLATSGGFGRIAPKFNTLQSKNEGPSATQYGAGAVLAINAGADVVNLEFSLGNGHSGWQNFSFMAGAPGGTWYPAARVVDDQGNAVVERVKVFDYDDPDYWQKNATQAAAFFKGRRIIEEYASKGIPLYLDMSAATDEELEYILWAMGNEGEMWLFREHLKENNINLKEVKVPITYKKQVSVISKAVAMGLYGVLTDLNFETNVKGLYAAGSELGAAGAVDASPALTFGFHAGASAAKRAKALKETPAPDPARVARLLEKVRARRRAQDGYHWKDVEHQVQSIVATFGVAPYGDKRVEAAIGLLRDLKKNARYKAADGFELSKSFETEFLVEIALAVFHAILRRKESVPPIFYRADKDGGEALPPTDKKPAEQEIFGLHKENGAYVYSLHKGSVKEKPAGYAAKY
jgi:succinate dehydrogenase/fumarate reductase flavoprotein subunit